MPWVRLDESFARHPKVVQAGPLGLAMQVAALCYCNEQLTDGFVPRAIARTLLDLDGLGDADWATVAADLITAGLWEETPGGYRIHDYHDYQPSKAEVHAAREQKQAAGRLGGQASAQARASAPAQARAQAERKQTASRRSSKTQADTQAEFKPDPVTDRSKSRSTPPSHRAVRDDDTASAPDPLDGFEEWWQTYPKRNGKRLARGKAEDQWRRLTPAEREQAIVGARHYAASGQIPQDAFRWLRDRAFTDWQTPAVPDPARNGSAPPRRGDQLQDMWLQRAQQPHPNPSAALEIGPGP